MNPGEPLLIEVFLRFVATRGPATTVSVVKFQIAQLVVPVAVRLTGPEGDVFTVPLNTAPSDADTIPRQMHANIRGLIMPFP